MNTKQLKLNAQGVKATLSGRKTMTRRPIKSQQDGAKDRCPYGNPGEIIPLYAENYGAFAFAKIKSVVVARLQDITAEDAMKEGLIEIEYSPPFRPMHRNIRQADRWLPSKRIL